MKKVLLIQYIIPNYRIPIFNKISEIYELTVMYSSGKICSDIKFKTILIGTHPVYKFIAHNQELLIIAQEYDIVIAPLSFSNLSILKLCLWPWRKYKFILWGIGVNASYSVHYDEPKSIHFLFRFLIKQSDALIFYTDFPKKKYSSLGFNDSKMFVAHNTVEVIKADYFNESKRDGILFIGTLYKAKGLFELLEQYKKACENVQDIPVLRIVGNGGEFNEINSWILQNNLHHKIFLLGAIYNEYELQKLFNQTIVCISPFQAGLSVQKSMGYGVPFITMEDAYTGGERLDIINGENGVLLRNEIELLDLLLNINIKKDDFKNMGINAYNFYWNNRTTEIMVKGFTDAINYTMKN